MTRKRDLKFSSKRRGQKVAVDGATDISMKALFVILVAQR